jgi:heat shock protein HtpX
VCVTHGLLQHLSTDELEGVLAHELSHIKNRDTAINTAVATIVSAISMIGNMLAWSMLFGRDRGGGNIVGLLFGVIVAPLLATMIQLAISRSREFTADSTAAEYTRPGFLASALQTIETLAEQAPLQANHQGTAHLFIANPFRKQKVAKLFSTHPPTEERVARLQRLQ